LHHRKIICFVSFFFSVGVIVINIVKAENGEIIDEWTLKEFQFKSLLAKLVKEHISDKMQQNITLAKFKMLGFTDLKSLKFNFYKENRKLRFNIDDVITKLGYLPFKKNLQKEIEQELISRFL
jgi:hypothetical protein